MVYNLQVAGPHEYFANGVLVSNCAAARYLACWLVRGGGGAWKATQSSEDRSLTADVPVDVFEKDDDRPQRSGRITHGDAPNWLDERFPQF